MDRVEELLGLAYQHALSGQGRRWMALVAEALALDRQDPPTLARAEMWRRHGAGTVPDADLLPCQQRAVEIALALGHLRAAHAWTRELARTALEARKPEAALPLVQALRADPALPEADRTIVQKWERALTRAGERAAVQVPFAPPPAQKPAPPRRKPPPKGQVTRWENQIRGTILRAARSDGVHEEAVQAVVSHLAAFARDLRALGGDRTGEIADNLEPLGHSHHRLQVVANDTDAVHRLQALDDLGEEATFSEYAAYLLPSAR